MHFLHSLFLFNLPEVCVWGGLSGGNASNQTLFRFRPLLGGNKRLQKLTHLSWGQSCHRLQSSCPERPVHRSHPVAAPEEVGVSAGGHHQPAHAPPNHCHCSSPESHPAGEMWHAAETKKNREKERETYSLVPFLTRPPESNPLKPKSSCDWAYYTIYSWPPQLTPRLHSKSTGEMWCGEKMPINAYF